MGGIKLAYLLISVTILFIPITFGNDRLECFGTKCYENTNAPLKVNEIIIDIVLHRDGSLSYSQTIGLSYSWSDVNFSIRGAIIPEFQLPKNLEFYPDTQVKEVLTGKEFKEVYNFYNGYCFSQFIFDNKKNLLKLCIEPQKQFKIDIESDVLSNSDFFIGYDENNSIERDIGINFLNTNYKYPIYIKLKGDEDIIIDRDDDRSCYIKNSSSFLSDVKQFSRPNGFMCQASILPINNSAFINLKIKAKDFVKIQEKEQREMSELQRASIKASIIADQRSDWSLIFTAILAVITGFYAYVAHKTWGEMKRANRPILSPTLSKRANPFLIIQNIGNITARNINIYYKLKPKGFSESFKYHLLKPKDIIRVPIKDKNNKALSLKRRMEFKKIQIIITYEDTDKEIYKDRFKIDIKQKKV